MKQRILFLDDEQSVLNSLRRILRPQRHDWEMTFLDNPIKAWELLTLEPFDAMVCDLNMPEMTGLDLLKRLQSNVNTKNMPVVVLTGEADRSLKRVALDLGATDLLNKPVDGVDLVARLRNVLRLKEYQDRLRDHNERLEELISERTRELAASRIEIIWRLAKAAEYRDKQTGHHVIRVGWYSRIIAREIGTGTAFADAVYLAAPLHDVGKIAIPDAILRKPGRLNRDEWETMQTHARLGAELLGDDRQLRQFVHESQYGLRDASSTDATNPILAMARTIALTHHEKWDGSGYPQGLVGDEIPLESRIVAIADVYDALRFERPYKTGFPETKALGILAENIGTHFDPSVYAAFMNGLDEIRRVEAAYADTTDPSELVEVR